jgi:hypothetical protein
MTRLPARVNVNRPVTEVDDGPTLFRGASRLAGQAVAQTFGYLAAACFLP